VVVDIRSVKEDAEVARLEFAARTADAALADVRHRLHEGLTEEAFRRELEAAMDDHGSEGPSFETIVASGPNGAMPHARPTERVIGSSGQGETVVIDFGATCDGYHSDMTRTFVVGDPSPTQRDMYDVVRRSQAAGVLEVRAGVRCSDVDRACRDVIADAGWADAFGHGTGHGIGLEIHERPRLSAVSTDVLASGHCVTVEPGVYLPDHGGVRIEDSMVVTAEGARLLTSAPHE
jgi:Xaa-Pro aminopeptidase